MRFAARALVGVLLVVGGHDAAAAESGSSWWPFGHHDEATVSQPAGVAASSAPLFKPQTSNAASSSPPAASGPVAHEAQLPPSPPETTDSSKSALHWPHLKMPELPKPHLPKAAPLAQKPKTESSRNTWVEKLPTPPKPSPLQSMKNGAHRVTAGTKTAWHKSVAALTPGQQSKPDTGSRVARRQVQPPFWKRMLGAKEPELQQPQTVPQWMAQKRLDP